MLCSWQNKTPAMPVRRKNAEGSVVIFCTSRKIGVDSGGATAHFPAMPKRGQKVPTEFEINREGAGDFFFHAVRSGNIIAHSEGYRRKAACQRSLDRLIESILDGNFSVRDLTTKPK